MARRLLTLLLLLTALGPAGADDRGGTTAPPAYPATRRVDVTDTLHGVRVPDPYRWLEDDDDPEVVAWDEAQQALLDGWTATVPDRDAVRARIAAELEAGSKPGLPVFRGARRFHLWRPDGKDHALVWTTDAEGTTPPRPVLDPNAWSADASAGLKGWWASPSGRYVAYARDRFGSEASELRIHDVERGEDLPDLLPRTKFTDVVWRPDETGFLYVRLPAPDEVPPGEAQYHRRVVHHRIGDLAVDDRVIGWAGRPAIEWPWLGLSSDQRTFLAGRELEDDTWETFEVRWTPDGAVLEPRLVGLGDRTTLDRAGDLWILLTDRDAPRRRVCVATDAELPDPAAWRTIVPEGEGVIEEVRVVGTRLVVHRRVDVVSRLSVVGLDGREVGEIALPGDGAVTGLAVRPDDPRVWIEHEAYDRPASTLVADLGQEGLPVSTVDTEPTTIDWRRLVATRHLVPSKDGTRIPVFLLHRRDVPLDGSAPTVLYGYGGFRVSLEPRWSRSMALWADLGGVQAVACLRGGLEYGEAWHEAGSLGQKQNVFDDFAAVGDWLVASGRARHDRLALVGGSNGGLLVAAVVDQRPDLAAAAIAMVPLTDMLRFHRFQYARAWTPEYGSPDDPEAFRWLRAYSPYHNVREGVAYPAVLVTAGLHDGRVDAFHARKIVARWQAATSSSAPILLSIDRASGHGASSTSRQVEQLLVRFLFLRRTLGVAPDAGR